MKITLKQVIIRMIVGIVVTFALYSATVLIFTYTIPHSQLNDKIEDEFDVIVDTAETPDKTTILFLTKTDNNQYYLVNARKSWIYDNYTIIREPFNLTGHIDEEIYSYSFEDYYYAIKVSVVENQVIVETNAHFPWMIVREVVPLLIPISVLCIRFTKKRVK